MPTCDACNRYQNEFSKFSRRGEKWVCEDTKACDKRRKAAKAEREQMALEVEG